MVLLCKQKTICAKAALAHGRRLPLLCEMFTDHFFVVIRIICLGIVLWIFIYSLENFWKFLS